MALPAAYSDAVAAVLRVERFDAAMATLPAADSDAQPSALRTASVGAVLAGAGCEYVLKTVKYLEI